MDKNALVPSRYNQDYVTHYPKIDFEDVVDRTDFKIGSDTARDARIAESGGELGSQSLYDFNSDNEVKIDKLSNAELALRSGGLDKADVDTLARAMKKSAELEAQDKKTEKEKAAQNAIDSARQSYLDKQTGFTDSMNNNK